MERLRAIFKQPEREQEYEPLHNGANDVETSSFDEVKEEIPFSWWEYFVFLLLGVAMLWAW